MAKLPSFQFYPGDWMKDPALRACSAAARGLWMDMLCLAFESDRRGFLQAPNGKPYSHEQLARMTGCLPDEVSRLLAELETSGVFSRTKHGIIFSRRLKRDEEERAENRARQNDFRRNHNKPNRNSNANITHDVTPVSHPSSSSTSASSSASTSKPNTPLKGGSISPATPALAAVPRRPEPEEPYDPTSNPEDHIPAGLATLQYAGFIREVLFLSVDSSTLRMLGDSIEMLAKSEGCAMNEATRRMLNRARKRDETRPMRFWLTDGGWKPGSAVARGSPSRSSEARAAFLAGGAD